VIVLGDTDVLIDFALDRKPHAEAAALLLDALEQRPGTAFVAWHSLSNFFYMVSPVQGKRQTKDFLPHRRHPLRRSHHSGRSRPLTSRTIDGSM
jgi:predicted nucleic acid-binding protein